MIRFTLRFTLLSIAVLLTLLPIALDAQQPQPAQTQPQTPPQLPVVPIGSLNLQNASLTEFIDQMAKSLGMNYILDSRVKGSVSINTYGETRALDARNLLEMVLRI